MYFIITMEWNRYGFCAIHSPLQFISIHLIRAHYTTELQYLRLIVLVQVFRTYSTQKVLSRRHRFAFPMVCYRANNAFLTRIGYRWSMLECTPRVSCSRGTSEYLLTTGELVTSLACLLDNSSNQRIPAPSNGTFPTHFPAAREVASSSWDLKALSGRRARLKKSTCKVNLNGEIATLAFNHLFV